MWKNLFRLLHFFVSDVSEYNTSSLGLRFKPSTLLDVYLNVIFLRLQPFYNCPPVIDKNILLYIN